MHRSVFELHAFGLNLWEQRNSRNQFHHLIVMPSQVLSLKTDDARMLQRMKKLKRLGARKTPIGNLLALCADCMDPDDAVNQIDSDLADLLYIPDLDLSSLAHYDTENQPSEYPYH